MKTTYFLFLAFIVLSFSCVSQTSKINGVSFVAAKDTITQQHVAPVLNIHSNFVSLMPYGFIKDVSVPTIIHNTDRQWFGETKKGMVQYAKKFQEKNVGVMVKPHLWLWKGGFTGDLKMTSEAGWLALEKTYTEFILTYAKAAEEIQADILCIGTELEQFVVNRPAYWQNLIKEIRKIYKGKLTYAANWDEFKRVPFLSKLDYIGIDAYFPLSDKKTPSLADNELGWQAHKIEIIKIQKQYQKPILFTEFGYRSVDFTSKIPWETKLVENEVNLKAQVNALQAIHNQFWSEEWFAGGFVWKWFHRHDASGGLQNNRFTPQNKPAENLLKEIYGKK